MQKKWVQLDEADFELIMLVLRGEQLSGSPMSNIMRCSHLAQEIKMQLQFDRSPALQTAPQSLPDVVDAVPGQPDATKDGWCTKKW